VSQIFVNSEVVIISFLRFLIAPLSSFLLRLQANKTKFNKKNEIRYNESSVPLVKFLENPLYREICYIEGKLIIDYDNPFQTNSDILRLTFRLMLLAKLRSFGRMAYAKLHFDIVYHMIFI
jgi:hypothetical protein